MHLVQPLEPEWEHRLAEIARQRGLPDSSAPERLAEAVRALSDRYNRVQRGSAHRDRDYQAARLGFFFARDVPKGAAALRELAPVLPRRPLRILDLGSGLGATAIGAIRALRAAGHTDPITVKAVDEDAKGLAFGAALAAHLPDVEWATSTADVREVLGRFDLVLLGQTLCELDASTAEAERAARHAGWLGDLLRHRVAADGALVVIEPALREPTRHLQRVRDVLAGRGLTPFAPCLHAAACPMLEREGDWCHEHLDVDLPPWLVPVARAAGLRWEGLTYAYLIVRPDGSRRPGRLRVVSEPLVSKGRRDVWLCGEFADGCGRRKVGRLDRHRSDTNAAFDELRRGDVVDLDGERVGPDTPVTRG